MSIKLTNYERNAIEAVYFVENLASIRAKKILMATGYGDEDGEHIFVFYFVLKHLYSYTGTFINTMLTYFCTRLKYFKNFNISGFIPIFF